MGNRFLETFDERRPPRGGRGLKLLVSAAYPVPWNSRPPRGGRGLKCLGLTADNNMDRRPPRGGRGLKFWGL